MELISEEGVEQNTQTKEKEKLTTILGDYVSFEALKRISARRWHKTNKCEETIKVDNRIKSKYSGEKTHKAE